MLLDHLRASLILYSLRKLFFGVEYTKIGVFVIETQWNGFWCPFQLTHKKACPGKKTKYWLHVTQTICNVGLFIHKFYYESTVQLFKYLTKGQ